MEKQTALDKIYHSGFFTSGKSNVKMNRVQDFLSAIGSLQIEQIQIYDLENWSHSYQISGQNTAGTKIAIANGKTPAKALENLPPGALAQMANKI